MCMTIANNKQTSMRNVVKIRNYYKIVKLYDADTFRSHFRMSRSCVEKLIVDELNDLVIPGERRPRVETKTAILMTLWHLGNPTSYRDLSDRFGVSQGCCAATILFFCKILTKLSKKFIKWPNLDESKLVIQKFNNLRGPNSFPNVVGCIDGMHIPIPAPSIEGSSYYNRKGFHTLILQGICDSEYKFQDVFFGWPGRSHDASVWSYSLICKKLQTGCIALPMDCHLLGDSAYPLNKFLIVPYKDNGCLSTKQYRFNTKLSSTRTVIEQAFGILKSRFRRLKFLPVTNLQNAKYFVMASIVLHNYIIGFENDTDEFLEQINEDTENEPTHNHYPPENEKSGTIKRDYLCELF